MGDERERGDKLMHCYQWSVSPKETNARLFNAVRRGLPLMPQSMVASLFEKRDVKMNGIRCSPNDTVKAGALIQVYSDYSPVLQSVYSDKNIIVINKPAGLCVEDPCCGMTVLSILSSCGNEDDLKLCHRLDSKTSGLLVVAKNQSTWNVLTEAFRMVPLESKGVRRAGITPVNLRFIMFGWCLVSAMPSAEAMGWG